MKYYLFFYPILYHSSDCFFPHKGSFPNTCLFHGESRCFMYYLMLLLLLLLLLLFVLLFVVVLLAFVSEFVLIFIAPASTLLLRYDNCVTVRTLLFGGINHFLDHLLNHLGVAYSRNTFTTNYIAFSR